MRDCWANVRFYLASLVTAVMMYAAPGPAYSNHHPSIVGPLPIATLLVVVALSAVISRPWLWQKVAFDKPMLPSVTRFVLSTSPHDEAERSKALAFGCSGASAQHLVIIGPPKSGQTSLAIAIGVEALLSPGGEHGHLLYTSFWRLLDRAAEEKQGVPESKLQGQPGERPVWPPQEARLLIIDDIGAQAHDGRSLLSPAAFAHELRSNEAVLKMCRGKRVMWVVSDDPRKAADWTEAIADAFRLSSPTEVELVEPNRIIGYAARLRPLRRAA